MAHNFSVRLFYGGLFSQISQRSTTFVLFSTTLKSLQVQYHSKAMDQFLTSNYFVNGEWKTAKSVYPVHNPYSGEVIANAADCTEKDTLDAVKHAADAFQKWKKTTGKVGSFYNSV